MILYYPAYLISITQCYYLSEKPQTCSMRSDIPSQFMKDPLYEINCMPGFIFWGLQAPVDWEDVDVTPVKGPDGNFRLPPKIFESMDRTKVGLKGPLATPIGKGHQSLNLALRK